MSTAEEIVNIVSWLEGRKIMSVYVETPPPPPGFDGEPAVEGVRLTLDDGSTVRLWALGWDGIQSLIVDREV